MADDIAAISRLRPAKALRPLSNSLLLAGVKRSASMTTLLTRLDPPLREALQAARMQIRLASPYVGGGTALWMLKLTKKSKATWQLLTALGPVAAAYGSLHLAGLKDLLRAGVEISHLHGLHGKVFLTESRGFVGSANLTVAGLGGGAGANRELTVALDDGQRGSADVIYQRWWRAARPVTEAMIDECERQAALIPTRVPRPPTPSSASSRRADSADDLLRRAADVKVWIKAIYRDATSADERWENGAWIGSSARGRPSFKVGDLVLIYAVKAKACNAVVRVTEPPVLDPARALREGATADADRWPWITEVAPELQVPIARGVPLTELGLTGRSLQGGHCHMPTGGLTAALNYLLR
jgi:hypothetical protein